MKVALLSDVHGNAIALAACLDRVQRAGAQRLYFLGDVAGYLPEGRACLELLEAADALPQRGNHDELLLNGGAQEPAYRHAPAIADLGPALPRLAGWPVRREERWDELSVLLVHGSPGDPLDGRVYPDGDLGAVAESGHDVVVMGHTHRPFVATVEGRLIVNAGSVGLPRDVGALSSFVLYDTETRTAVVERVPMDVDAVLARYGADLHESVRAVLRRTSDDFVGVVAS